MYVCENLVCNLVCDFCWFCEHDENGIPKSCSKDKNEDFCDGIGCCHEFKCSLHEVQS